MEDFFGRRDPPAYLLSSERLLIGLEKTLRKKGIKTRRIDHQRIFERDTWLVTVGNTGAYEAQRRDLSAASGVIPRHSTYRESASFLAICPWGWEGQISRTAETWTQPQSKRRERHSIHSPSPFTTSISTPSLRVSTAGYCFPGPE